MKLVQTIKKNKFLPHNWGIYELSEEESKKYGGNYVLLRGLHSSYEIAEADKLLSDARYKYEGFFETQREAFLQVQLAEMDYKIKRLEFDLDKYKLLFVCNGKRG